MGINAVNTSIGVNNYTSKDTVESPLRGAIGKDNATNKTETLKDKTRPQEMDGETLTRDDIDMLTDKLNKVMSTFNTDLHFELHEETNRMIVQFVDRKNNQIVKEFPPRELLDTLAAIRDYIGVLLDKRV